MYSKQFFFLTENLVAARSHCAGSVVEAMTFNMSQASAVCEVSFRLDCVFSGPLSSDLGQGQNTTND